jgi:hypothetical protein
MNKPWNLFVALLVAALGGCAGGNWQGDGPLYRCENGIDFRVKFIDDTALLEGPGGRDLLQRDAGGQGPQQTVYSNPRMRAEFGLGTSGREARLHYPMLPLSVRCVRN